MVSVNFQTNEKVYESGGAKKVQTAPFPLKNSPIDNNQAVKSGLVSFKAAGDTSAVSVRTQLSTSDEKKKYKEISEELNGKYRKKLDYALKSGILLKNDSDDKSSVLDNLHKILKTERDPGLNNVALLQECLDIIQNPYVITQTAEDIPPEYKTPVIGIMTNMSEDMKEIEEANDYLNNLHMGTCPTASVEFDLATKQPAEFFRMVEGLTSPKHTVYKKVDLRALNENTVAAIWLLINFKTPIKNINFDRAIVELKPDENAIIRARIQNSHKDKGERSMIDVMMQSTMMQLGSQQTYDSISDRRAPNAWTTDDSGLIEFEKTYVESIMENKSTTSELYQELDEEGYLAGYKKDFAAIKKDLMDTLALGHNVIIGYTFPDPYNNNRLAGHEITIVGTKTDKNGGTIFICQDSDDEFDRPREIHEKLLLPAIHHAGLPEEIAMRDKELEETWEMGLKEYEKIKDQ